MKVREISRVKINEHTSMPSIILGSYQINNDETLYEILKTALNCGVYGFDTSPSYGNQNKFGISLSRAATEVEISREKLFITGKIDGWQMCRTNGAVKEYVFKSMEDLHIDYFDLLLVHWPFEKYLINTWKCLEEMYADKLIREIGLCNVNRRVFDRFMSCDIEVSPQVIQNEISPLRTATEEVKYFQNAGICVEAYSPLARMLPQVKESQILLGIGKKYNKSVAQIILRWHIQCGIVPVFTSSNPKRIASNVDIFDFELTVEEIEQINGLNQNYKIFPESYGCPGF